MSLYAQAVQTNDVQGQPNTIEFNIASNILVAEGSVVSVDFVPVMPGGLLSTCSGTSNSSSTTQISIQLSGYGSIATPGNRSDFFASSCFKTTVEFRLPGTLLPKDNLTFRISLINPKSTNAGSVSTVRIQGCRSGMVLSGWSTLGSVSLPLLSFAEQCSFNAPNCEQCRRGQMFMESAAVQEIGRQAVIMVASQEPSILEATVEELSPVNP